MAAEERAPAGVDPRVPNVARMYNYYLGGKDNFRADRKAAEQIIATVPQVPVLARANRAFLKRAVRFLASEAGIRQFVDIGTGLPTQGSVHEVVHSVAPDLRVAYVDNDSVVLAHARALLPDDDRTTVVQADMRSPGDVLAEPGLRAVIDLDLPFALLFVAVLHFVAEDEDPYAMVARYRDAMAPGSYVAISHGALGDSRSRELAAQVEPVYEHATSAMTPRTREQIQRLFDGFALVEPGLVPVPEWRPDPGAESPAGAEWNLGGVGRRS